MQLLPRMKQYLDRWLTLTDMPKEYDNLCEFLVKDQLLSNCPNDLRVFLKERSFASSVDMAQGADRYILHKILGVCDAFQTKADFEDSHSKFNIK